MSNSYLTELLRLCQNRYAVDSDDMSYGDWIIKNTHLKGRPFSFSRYPFQRQICDDMHPNLCCKKVSQIGLTEIQIRKALAFLARNRATTLIYTFPDDDMRKRNSQTRIQPLLESTRAFNLDSTIDPIRAIALNQVGQSFMHITGSKEGDATSTSADMVISDEIDLTDQQMLALFSSRLQGSEWKVHQQFSTPTYSGFGISLQFDNSDQHEYMIKCDCCNHWQYPVFTPDFIEIPNLPSSLSDLTEIDQGLIDEHKIDVLNSQVVCEKCRAPLDLGREDNRSWVSKYPSRTHSRGYRINPFSTKTLPPSYVIQQLLKYKQLDFIRGFRNTVLGEADDAGSQRLSEAEINLVISPSANPNLSASDTPTWVGIDMGQTCHMVVGQGYDLDSIQIIKFEAFNVDLIFEKVKNILDNYYVVGGLTDRHPYEPTSDAVQVLSQGLILPCEYRGEKELNIIKGPDGEYLYIQAERTQLLDEVVRAIRRKTTSFSGYGNNKTLIITHLRNMVREEVPEKKATWKKLDEQDHYFHALGFLYSAVKLRGLKAILTEDHRSNIAIVGVDIGGYNTDITGLPTKQATKLWLPSLLR